MSEKYLNNIMLLLNASLKNILHFNNVSKGYEKRTVGLKTVSLEKCLKNIYVLKRSHCQHDMKSVL